MDFLNQSGGGGGRNPLSQSGLSLWPPMSMLQGGGPAPAGMMDQAAAAPDQGPDATAQGGESTVDILNRMIQDAQDYLSVEQDEEDKLTMAKVLTMLQGYLAKEQKESDQAMQGKASPRLMRQAYGG